jgi:hypothetical protein
MSEKKLPRNATSTMDERAYARFWRHYGAPQTSDLERRIEALERELLRGEP